MLWPLCSLASLVSRITLQMLIWETVARSVFAFIKTCSILLLTWPLFAKYAEKASILWSKSLTMPALSLFLLLTHLPFWNIPCNPNSVAPYSSSIIDYRCELKWNLLCHGHTFSHCIRRQRQACNIQSHRHIDWYPLFDKEKICIDVDYFITDEYWYSLFYKERIFESIILQATTIGIHYFISDKY